MRPEDLDITLHKMDLKNLKAEPARIEAMKLMADWETMSHLGGTVLTEPMWSVRLT